MVQVAIILFSAFINASQAAPVTCFEGRPDVKRKAKNGDTHLIYNVEAKRNQKIEFKVNVKKSISINSCAGEKTVAISKGGRDIILKRHNGALSSNGKKVTLALSKCPELSAGGRTQLKLIRDKVVKKCNIKIKKGLKKIPSGMVTGKKPRVIYVKNKVGNQRCGEPISLVRAKRAQSKKTNKDVRDECTKKFKNKERFKACYGQGSKEIGRSQEWIQNHAKCCPSGMAFKGFDKPKTNKPSEKVAVKCVSR